MSLADATRIVTRLGPCTVAIDRARDPDLARHLARLGCVVRGRGEDAPVVVARPGDAPPATAATLVVVAEGEERASVEAPLLDGGWRRHPAGMLGGEAAAWGATEVPRLTFYRRGRGAGLLSRGADADGAIARFALAGDLVRNGDRVLVRGVDEEDGGAIIAAVSRAGEVIVGAGPASSLDAVVLMPAPDADTDALLDGAAAALKPDGRLLVGWRGEGAAIEAAIADRFIVDRRLVQADGGTLVVASADPFALADAAPYRHPAFARGEGTPSVLTDFAAAYDNPFLHRTMVQIGERIGDEMVLARLAECVLEEAGAVSADRGAAIAVLGYRVLDLGLDGSIAAVVLLIDAYLAATAASRAPHVLRWRLSLLFLAGRLAELAGDADAAVARFHAASRADWAGFSPILATKAIAAAFHEARLHLAAARREAAAGCFRHGLDTALTAAAAPHARLIGDPQAPVPFYLQEMAEVMDMGGQCAVALNSLHLLDRDPGLFWRQVDAKRFGLFAWADGLQREQARLHG